VGQRCLGPRPTKRLALGCGSTSRGAAGRDEGHRAPACERSWTTRVARSAFVVVSHRSGNQTCRAMPTPRPLVLCAGGGRRRGPSTCRASTLTSAHGGRWGRRRFRRRGRVVGGGPTPGGTIIDLAVSKARSGRFVSTGPGGAAPGGGQRGGSLRQRRGPRRRIATATGFSQLRPGCFAVAGQPVQGTCVMRRTSAGRGGDVVDRFAGQPRRRA